MQPPAHNGMSTPSINNSYSASHFLLSAICLRDFSDYLIVAENDVRRRSSAFRNSANVDAKPAEPIPSVAAGRKV